MHQYQQHQQLLLDQMAAQQRQHEAATSTMRLQLEALQQQLAGVAAKLQTRDAQAKKYKEAVRLLKVGRLSCLMHVSSLELAQPKQDAGLVGKGLQPFLANPFPSFVADPTRYLGGNRVGPPGQDHRAA